MSAEKFPLAHVEEYPLLRCPCGMSFVLIYADRGEHDGEPFTTAMSQASYAFCPYCGKPKPSDPNSEGGEVTDPKKAGATPVTAENSTDARNFIATGPTTSRESSPASSDVAEMVKALCEDAAALEEWGSRMGATPPHARVLLLRAAADMIERLVERLATTERMWGVKDLVDLLSRAERAEAERDDAFDAGYSKHHEEHCEKVRATRVERDAAIEHIEHARYCDFAGTSIQFRCKDCEKATTFLNSRDSGGEPPTNEYPCGVMGCLTAPPVGEAYCDEHRDSRGDTLRALLDEHAVRKKSGRDSGGGQE